MCLPHTHRPVSLLWFRLRCDRYPMIPSLKIPLPTERRGNTSGYFEYYALPPIPFPSLVASCSERIGAVSAPKTRSTKASRYSFARGRA